MKRLTKRVEDISARFQFANAERGTYKFDSEYYKQLSEVVSAILSEYKNKSSNRYSFRLIGNKYKLVVLTPCEKF